ncbi:putative glutathione S-transferase 6 [Smittium culicis]|uniref:Putative glutathione S-transferase 6 n=1 Tax=Smittium culicis TaxID=133412 RepID=A0A1R1X6M0_9FUNG|nr:putative glutathione S-transferase 6 [Smittium culicis]OMJ17833.1 putative glutathione S-transferase 6 [Smittium culicis]
MISTEQSPNKFTSILKSIFVKPFKSKRKNQRNSQLPSQKQPQQQSQAETRQQSQVQNNKQTQNMAQFKSNKQTHPASSFELVYFPITARAQTTRTMLSLADANWKNRVPQWPQEKDSMPFGRLPQLNETRPDGSKFSLVESAAIERYLAREYGFLPSDVQIAAQLEAYVLQIADSYDAFIHHAVKTRTAESHAAMVEQFKFLFSRHEPILASNPSGHYYGNSITYPDVVLYTLYNQAKDANSAELFNNDECPNIMKLVTSMDSNPKIAAAIAAVA